jgi:DNA-binding HxlR family transcriptional regulator
MDHWRSNCPIACTLELIGDRWTLLVLRDLFLGAHYFDEFLESGEGIATNILGDRLRKLERDGFITRARDRADARRFRYALTERGKSLKPVMLAVVHWGLAQIEGTVSRIPPAVAKGAHKARE